MAQAAVRDLVNGGGEPGQGIAPAVVVGRLGRPNAELLRRLLCPRAGGEQT